MDGRIERMKQVAEKGNIDGFYNLIQEDVKYLEYFDEFPFVDTPLHTAAIAGNIPVAMEIMRLKPSFARKPNRDGFSPIDLALRNGHSKMVHQLLHVDQDLVRVRGKGNMTPLHHVAKRNDQLDLLNEFMSICPDSITDLTTQNETALHIALKNDNIKSFEALVGWLASNWSQNALDYERKILNWKDEEGNTVLHIAVSKKQTQAVRHLFDWSSEVDVKIKNEEGETAWGILQTQTQERNSGLHESIQSFHNSSKLDPNSSQISTRLAYAPSQHKRLSTDEYIKLFKGTDGTEGTANLLNTIPFSMFLFANSVTFLISNSVTILLIPDGYIGWMLSGTQAFLWACYIVSCVTLTGYNCFWITLISISTALYLILLQAFSVWTRIRRRRHGPGLSGLKKKKEPSLEAGVV